MKADADLMEKLPAHDAEVDIRTLFHRYSLHMVADHGYIKCAGVIVKAGSNINIPDHWGKTP